MDVWDFNLRHLRILTLAAKLGSVIGAARAANLSQPAATQAISRLESQIGLQLLERHPDGVSSTEIASKIMPRLESALEFIASNRVTSAQARAFIALARTGSFSGASALTSLAPATLHRSVTELEGTLGKKLTDRRGRGVELTGRGQAIARRLRLARAELQAALDEISIYRGDRESRIAIGAMPLCRARLLPNAIVKYLDRERPAEIVIREGSFSELIEPLRDGEVDLLIGALRDPSPSPDVEQAALFADRPTLLASRLHPLARRDKPATLKQMRTYPWVVPPKGVPLREQWEQMFENARLDLPEIPVECGSVIAIRQILINTDFLTILSPDQVAVELEAGWLSIIGDTPASLARTIGVMTRKGWRPTKAQSDFLAVLKEEAGQAV